MPSLSDLPYEVLQLIAAESVTRFDDAPNFLSLLLVSKRVHRALVGDYVFKALFDSVFDSAAAPRRLGPECVLTPNIYADAFKRRCCLLRMFRANTPFGDIAELERGLWEVYFMMLDDEGKNMVQLEQAGMHDYLKKTLLDLVAGHLDEHRRVIESTILQLVAASFSIISDRAHVLQETIDESYDIIDALQCIFVAPHLYPIAHLPLTVAHPHEIQNHTAIDPNSAPSIANQTYSQPQTPTYFGHALPFVAPLLYPSIFAIVTNRRERRDIGLLPNTPRDRAEAVALESPQPTVKDYDELNLFRRMAVGAEVPRAGGGRENPSLVPGAPLGSRRWDHAFRRMWAVGEYLAGRERWRGDEATWFEAMYEPGMFAGRWLGRFEVPDWRFLQQMVEMHPASVDEVLRTFEMPPMMGLGWFQAELREYHSVNEDPLGSFGGQNFDNAYFHGGVDFTDRRSVRVSRDTLTIVDPTEPDPAYADKVYRLVQEPGRLPYPRGALPAKRVAEETPQMLACEAGDVAMTDDDQDDADEQMPEDVEMEFDQAGVGSGVPHLDIVITGENDALHALAWGGAQSFFGRVRKLDGLLVLVRVSQNDVDHGRWVFSGYMHLAGTVIGMWRQGGVPVQAVGMQGTFMISKVGPEVRIMDSVPV